MSQDPDRAINAIWHTEMDSPEEKLVLYHLASKHELGERYSTAWKSLGGFLNDFEDKWCGQKELIDATQMSNIKFDRTVETLSKRGYIKKVQRVQKSKSGTVKDKSETMLAITPKLFTDYQSTI